MAPSQIELTKSILAPPSIVWDYLTTPGLMAQWMGEPEMDLEILTDWKVGNPIIFRGFHHGRFENKGTVLTFEPCTLLCYTHLSSISHLPEIPGSYTIHTFRLEACESTTTLTIILSNFPTESIFKHLDFYWQATIDILKESVEIINRT